MPREMEPERKRMQVPEHVEGDASYRALRYAHEYDVTQLGEQRRRESQSTIGNQQREWNRDHRLFRRQPVHYLL
jgi:hypothetical protein